MFRWDFLCFSLCLLPPVLALGTAEKILAMSSWYPPLRYLHDQIPLSLLILKLNKQFLIWEKIQSLHHFSCFSLHSLQEIHVPFLPRIQKLHRVLHICPHQGWVEKKTHLFQPAINVSPSATQDSFLATKAHCWLLAKQPPGPHVLLHRVTFQEDQPLTCMVYAFIPLQVQDPAKAFVVFQEVCFCSSLQPVEILLNGSTALCAISHSSSSNWQIS